MHLGVGFLYQGNPQRTAPSLRESKRPMTWKVVVNYHRLPYPILVTLRHMHLGR